MTRILPVASALLVLATVAACTQTSAPPSAPAPASSGVTTPGFRLPEGTGCSGEIARFRAVLANDLETGHVGRTVHERIGGELDQAAGICSAGRDGEAQRLVSATKQRYGYR
jgi:hypothetical protein